MRNQNQCKFHPVLLILTVLLLAWVFSSQTSAAQKGNQTKGWYLMRTVCKECHTKNEVGREVTPLSKTMDQWKKYFASGNHHDGKEPLVKFLNTDQLLDVEAYLVGHAVDSEHPETCGR